MSLNIKSAEAHELARELAALEHTTMTDAVVISLKEAIERRRREQNKAAKAQRMHEVVVRMRDAYSAAGKPDLWAIADDLYDEQGQPK